jgi:hypothetical protein
MKNFMKKNIRRAIESWPSRKPWVKERLDDVLVGQSIDCCWVVFEWLTMSPGRQVVEQKPAAVPFCSRRNWKLNHEHPCRLFKRSAFVARSKVLRGEPTMSEAKR